METCLWSWVNGELELGFLSVVDGQSLHQEGSESRSGAPSETVEDEESLEPRALVGQLPDPVQHQVDDLLADCVVATRVVVGGVLLAGDQLLRMVQLAITTSSYFVWKLGKLSY